MISQCAALIAPVVSYVLLFWPQVHLSRAVRLSRHVRTTLAETLGCRDDLQRRRITLLPDAQVSRAVILVVQEVILHARAGAHLGYIPPGCVLGDQVNNPATTSV